MRGQNYWKTFGGFVENVYLCTKSRYENVLKEYESQYENVLQCIGVR